MFAFGSPPPRRRPSLTPMIDVIFLLVVFFMLAARFGAEGTRALALAGGPGPGWEGPPRLVTVAADGVALNGRPLPEAGLAAALAALGPATAPVVLQAAGDADLQRLVDVVEALAAAGHSRLYLAE
ncbi:MAG: biopolymer transporter ExbD [Rhodobacteraceae bacterium]|jgi:biopolymer transport protein ExbD|nr:biopolymer transporter ExbD [Paracoccaceae bacterium]